MLSIVLAMALVSAGHQDAAAAADGAARAEACDTYRALSATVWPNGTTAPPEHYVARDSARDGCIALGGSGPAYFDLFLRTANDDPATAREALEAAIALEPDNGRYLFRRGVLEQEFGRPGGADIERALLLDDDDRSLRIIELRRPQVLDALVAEGRHEAIVRLTSRLIDDGPVSHDYLVRGHALLALGRSEEALRDMDAAAAIHDDGETFLGIGARGARSIRFSRALALIRLGRGAEAVTETRLATSDEELLVYCRAQLEVGDARAALATCDRLARPDDYTTTVAAYRGLALERLGQTRQARRAYDEAVRAEEAGLFSQLRANLRDDGLETARAGLARLRGR